MRNAFRAIQRSAWPVWTLFCCALTAHAADLSFTDATDEAGLASAIHGYLLNASTGREMGSGGAIADFNNDGYQDIFFLSGGHTHDKLFLNNHDGTFTDHAAAWGLHDLPPHIGSAALAADFNDDGRTDLYITSHGPAGSNGQVAAHRLFLNLPPNGQGQPRFAELAVHCGVEQTALFATDGFGAAAGDIDLDGDLDLAEVNGWQPIPKFADQPALLFAKDGTGLHYTEIGAQTGFNHISDARGLARLDYDNDGDQDALIFTRLDRLTLLRNDLISDENQPADANWLRVFIDTGARTNLAPEGIGATVTAKTAAGSQRRHIDAGPTFQTSEERSAHFGLGTHGTVRTLDIEFHDGTLLRLENIPANQTLTVTLPPCRADLAEPFGVRDLADIQAFVGYFQSGARAANLADPGPDPHDAPVLDLADLAEFISQFLNCN
jgi:hypothetical protein